ncbi:hypothetical protein D3C80_713900 [compost metagenome]
MGVIEDYGTYSNGHFLPTNPKLAMAVEQSFVRGDHDSLAVHKVVVQGLTSYVWDSENPQRFRLFQGLFD